MLYSVLALAVAAVSAQGGTAPAEDPIVCRSSKVHNVGTRVKKAPVCKPQSVWDQESKRSQRELQQVTDRWTDVTPVPGGRR